MGFRPRRAPRSAFANPNAQHGQLRGCAYTADQTFICPTCQLLTCWCCGTSDSDRCDPCTVAGYQNWREPIIDALAHLGQCSEAALADALGRSGLSIDLDVLRCEGSVSVEERVEGRLWRLSRGAAA